MPRTKKNSFCCGAGGAQFWKEGARHEGRQHRSATKRRKATGAEVLAVGCPFCMQMFGSAKANVGEGPVVRTCPG
ncbi:MAG: (Fe-S)-binding protein [Chloroflexi bacterium]|nr:(Fe-S)-binding protein [Chloroflexota bacterium]